jgi:hypothetical protein
MKSFSSYFVAPVILISLFSFGCNDDDDNDDQQPKPMEVPCHTTSADEQEVAVATGAFEAPKTAVAVEVDGCSKDAVWAAQDWYSLNYRWMGANPDSADYYGRFKLAWDADYLYLLVEVTDDSLSPTLANGLPNYWKGDYVEVFLDEDQSGGNHQYNHQAFAYHVSTEGHAIDQSTQQEPIFFDDHVTVMRTREGNRYLWEMAIKVYDDQYDEDSADNVPVELTAQKTIGFSLAYGDNDGNNSRENFMGSRETHGANNDAGYINADVFGSVVLVEQ